MNEAELIELYHSGYMVCLVCAVIFLGMSIAGFFLFRIPQIWDMKTGRGVCRMIRRMEENNARTGQLLNIPDCGQTPVHLSRTDEISRSTPFDTDVTGVNEKKLRFEITKSVIWIHTEEKV